MSTRSSGMRAQGRDGRRITIKRLAFSVIEVVTSIRSLEKGTMMREKSERSLAIKATIQIPLKLASSPRRPFLWLLTIRLCLQPYVNLVQWHRLFFLSW